MIKSAKKLLLSLVFVISFAIAGISQPPPTPGNHGDEDDFSPAPIGGGIAILLALAGAYGAKKVYDARKKLRE